ncbi:hypothetical protein IPC991_19210, partial [Pseudomonas aeruginosa]
MPTTATGSLSTWCPNERRDRCTDRGHRPTAGPAGRGAGVRRCRPRGLGGRGARRRGQRRARTADHPA